jgi:hypothetical protein
MQLHTRDIQTKGVFGNNSQREEAIAYVDESIRRYERLLEKQSLAKMQSPSLRDKIDSLLMLAPFASSKLHDLPVMRSIKLASNLEDLRNAVEPFVLCTATIDSNSHMLVTPRLKLSDLPKDRTHRFLIEIHNAINLQDRLNIEVVNPSEHKVSSACEIRIVENIFSSAKLTGDEYEWKLIELRWKEPGNYDVKSSVGGLPLRQESRFVLHIPSDSP